MNSFSITKIENKCDYTRTILRIFTSSENVTTVKYFIFQKISVTIVEQFWEFSEFSKCSEMFVWLKCDYSQCVTLVTVSTTVTKFEGRIFFVFLF